MDPVDKRREDRKGADMFTGIVQMGRVFDILQKKHGANLMILAQFSDIQIGESIAIDGVCLTVTKVTDEVESVCLEFDISPETWQLTALQYLQQGAQVNMERALCIGDRLGGHFVTGHTDQTCSLAALRQEGEFLCMRFAGIHKMSMQHIIEKGSITVSGVSLTINSVIAVSDLNNDGFEVMLVPQTLKETNFKHLTIGDAVNIEFDMLAKVINNRLNIYREIAND